MGHASKRNSAGSWCSLVLTYFLYILSSWLFKPISPFLGLSMVFGFSGSWSREEFWSTVICEIPFAYTVILLFVQVLLLWSYIFVLLLV